MNVHKLKDFDKGWFIGNFNPTLVNTPGFEVAVKYYKKNDKEAKHHHKIATEFTIITEGEVRMNGKVFVKGDIIEILPNESTNFEALEDTTTVVVKLPSVKNDKYLD